MTFSKNETCWETIRIYQVIFATCAKERSNFPDITLKDSPLCINRPHISIAEETLYFPSLILFPGAIVTFKKVSIWGLR